MRTRLLAASLAAVGLLLLAGCSTPAAPGADEPVVCSYPSDGAPSRTVDAPGAEPAITGSVEATLLTSAGEIAITLDADAAPCTVNSFVSLADQGYYTDTFCHRLTTAGTGIFVLQCGDPSGSGSGGPGYSYADELTGSESYPAGTVAMANAGADTNGSQFFLVYEDTDLPAEYTVFAQMDAEGLEVVRTVAAGGVEGNAAQGLPVTPVTITGVTID